MMKVNILCNSEFSIPAIQWMVSQKIIQSIGIPDVINPYHDDIKAIALQSRIPLVKIHKESLVKDLITWLDDYPTSYVFVMTFPFIIPKECLTGKDIQWLNFHSGRLPDYRGPEPIFWSLRNGDEKTAICVHSLSSKIDGGPLHLMKETDIKETDTYGFLMNKLAEINVSVCSEILQMILSKQALPIIPISGNDHYYKRPGLNDVRINWQTQSAREIKKLIKSCNPWNKGAITSIKGMEIRFVDADLIQQSSEKGRSYGTILEFTESGMHVQCKDDKVIRIDVISWKTGIMAATQLKSFGIKIGEIFH